MAGPGWDSLTQDVPGESRMDLKDPGAAGCIHDWLSGSTMGPVVDPECASWIQNELTGSRLGSEDPGGTLRFLDGSRFKENPRGSMWNPLDPTNLS